MNPLTNTRKINEMNEKEARLGISDDKSWHQQYKESAWIFIGGLPYDLSEGDIICIFSQYGEPVNINLVRDQKSGKSKGFSFLCYEDQRSTVLAVDNFNGAKILGRTIRVDHVANYKAPKEGSDDEILKMLADVGCGPDVAKELERKAAAARMRVSEERKPDKWVKNRDRSRSPHNRGPVSSHGDDRRTRQDSSRSPERRANRRDSRDRSRGHPREDVRIDRSRRK